MTVKGSNLIQLIEPAPDCLAISREAWAKTHPDLRAEILRMVREFEAGFEKYRPAAERDAALADFHEMAAAKNTTLAAALHRYSTLENLLRADSVKGLEAILQNLGIDPQQWARGILAEPEAA
jgi:hypothetical protein